MNVVCYERVCYERGLLWTWSVTNGSVMMNVVCYEQVCYEQVCFEWSVTNKSLLSGHQRVACLQKKLGFVVGHNCYNSFAGYSSFEWIVCLPELLNWLLLKVITSKFLKCQLLRCCEHGRNLVGDTRDVCVPHFFRWGDIICHVLPFFLFRFCIWRSFKNKSGVYHVLREVLIMLDVHIAKLMMK